MNWQPSNQKWQLFQGEFYSISFTDVKQQQLYNFEFSADVKQQHSADVKQQHWIFSGSSSSGTVGVSGGSQSYDIAQETYTAIFRWIFPNNNNKKVGLLVELK